MFVTLALYPTAMYWMTYYVPNYAFGFVRRGLGGEIIRMLPDVDYFPAAYTMVWAAFSRNDLGTQLCGQIPHKQIEQPFPSEPMAYLAGQIAVKTDFHAWVCDFERSIVDARLTDGLHKVGAFGAGPLLASFTVGVLYFAVSIWATQSYSGLRIPALLGEVRGKLTAPILGLTAMVPLFVTAVDWTRWWVLITFNVVLVCIMYTLSTR
jgi:hypothetical protein